MANLSGNYLNSSISQLVCAFPSALNGVFISSATGATIAIFDSNVSTTFSPAIVSSFTPPSVGYYYMPFDANKGINVSVAGTITYTIGWD